MIKNLAPFTTPGLTMPRRYRIGFAVSNLNFTIDGYRYMASALSMRAMAASPLSLKTLCQQKMAPVGAIFS